VQFFGSGRFTFSAQYVGISLFQNSTTNSVTVVV
jgi:hypothetical protein